MAPIFTCPPAAKALVTLILIENSRLILPLWNDLRQHYLPNILGAMRITNPVIPIPVLWLTTAPVGDDPVSLHAPPPRQYNQLPDVKFSFTPDNKITSRIIHRATELMLETAAQFQGGPVSLHLVVVAASAPIPGTWGVSVTMPSQIGHSEWRLLGQHIAQLGIHCHMILPASQDMVPMKELFSTSRQLQGHTQVPPWFQTSPDYTFLFAGDTTPSPALTPATLDAPEKVPHPSDSPQRPPVLRHQSFPQDVQSPNGATPSLVSSLQKFHGLSRKKLYGAQPPRQPFVREEPVRSKYKTTPTPLSIPVGSQSFPEDRVPGKTKVERGRRSDRHIGDTSNSCSPGRRSPWNRVPSSDVGSSPSSPTTSLSSHRTTSPTIPLYPDLAGYPSPPAATLVPVSDTNFSSPLGDPSGGYPYQSPVIPVPSQTWPVSKAPPSSSVTTRRHSQELPHGAHMQSLSAMSSKYRLDTVSSDPRPAPKTAPKPKDAGDVPFIFSPELEAATAAKLKAALQSTSSPVAPASTCMSMGTFTGFTSGPSNYAVAEDAYASTQALAPAALQGYETMHPTGLVHANVEEPVRFVGSTSSSLQGWAG